jgi:hypothetical protein
MNMTKHYDTEKEFRGETLALLETAAKTNKERGGKYKDSMFRSSEALVALFPDGLTLRTAEDWTRAQTLMQIVGKLGRYCSNWEELGHEDSALDNINYNAILASLDRMFKRRRADGNNLSGQSAQT